MHRENGIYEPPSRCASDYLTFQRIDGLITSLTSQTSQNQPCAAGKEFVELNPLRG